MSFTSKYSLNAVVLHFHLLTRSSLSDKLIMNLICLLRGILVTLCEFYINAQSFFIPSYYSEERANVAPPSAPL